MQVKKVHKVWLLAFLLLLGIRVVGSRYSLEPVFIKLESGKNIVEVLANIPERFMRNASMIHNANKGVSITIAIDGLFTYIPVFHIESMTLIFDDALMLRDANLADDNKIIYGSLKSLRK